MNDPNISAEKYVSKIPTNSSTTDEEKKPLGLLLRFGVKVKKLSPENLVLLRDDVFHSYASNNDLSVENG